MRSGRLQVDELCHALAVEPGSADFNIRNVPLISILVGCCQGLITVDKEASTVQLVRFTLQEYEVGNKRNGPPPTFPYKMHIFKRYLPTTIA